MSLVHLTTAAVTIEPTGLVVTDPAVTLETWAEVGAALGRVGRSAVRWAVGDWVLMGEQLFGEKVGQVLEATGYSEGALASMAWVAKAFAPARRRMALSWSHHEAVAALEEPDQERVLHAAEQQALSRAEVRALVAEIAPKARRVQADRVSAILGVIGAWWDTGPELDDPEARTQAFLTLADTLAALK